MKVSGANGTGSVGGPRGVKPAGGGAAFSLPSVEAAHGAVGTTPTAGLSAVSGLEALLALQDVGGPLERRKRAVNRAGRILDVLDEVKLALIDGDLSAGSLDRLVRAVRDERQNTDDGRLEALLDEIETRAAVEIAKLEQAKIAA
ncbi:MAG: flagellar assembly protein FliX [Caulobacter sp.]|nr:flagellar assembly protein FliX [Caulobacter sp.]